MASFDPCSRSYVVVGVVVKAVCIKTCSKESRSDEG